MILGLGLGEDFPPLKKKGEEGLLPPPPFLKKTLGPN